MEAVILHLPIFDIFSPIKTYSYAEEKYDDQFF